MRTDIEYWSWPNHPFEYRLRTYIYRETRQARDIEEWLAENIDLSTCLTFDGSFGDCYFKNGEDAMAFKLRWL